MAAQVAEGELVLVLARVRKSYQADAVATVRIITAGSEGGPGYQQLVVPFDAVYCRLEDDRHAQHAPRCDWR